MLSLNFVDNKSYPISKINVSERTLNYIVIVHEDTDELDLIIAGLKRKFRQTSINSVSTIDEVILRLVTKKVNGDRYLIFSQYDQIHYAFQNYPGLFKYLTKNGIIFTDQSYVLKAFLSNNH